MIIHHGHRYTVTDTLLRTTLEHMSIEAGIGGCPFKLPLDKVTYLT